MKLIIIFGIIGLISLLEEIILFSHIFVLKLFRDSCQITSSIVTRNCLITPWDFAPYVSLPGTPIGITHLSEQTEYLRLVNLNGIY